MEGAIHVDMNPDNVHDGLQSNKCDFVVQADRTYLGKGNYEVLCSCS